MGANIESLVVTSTKAFTFLLFVFLWELRSGYSQSYDEMKSLNASCSPYDTCSPSRELEEDNLLQMNCECNSFCTRHGTCCLDSPYNPKLERKLPKSSPPDLQYSCETIADNLTDIFMVSKCKQDWQQDPEIKFICESNAYDYNDPHSLVPYTNPKSSTTYKNYYCALCNEDIDDSEPWDLSLGINMLSVYNKYKGDANEIFEDLVYDGYSRRWGVKVHASPLSVHQEKVFPSFIQQENIDSFFIQQEKVDPFFMQQEKIEDVNNDSELFEPIEFSLNCPFHLQTSITYCDAKVVSDCSSNWKDETIRDKCHSFMGTVYSRVKVPLRLLSTTVKFRNVYCAICNSITDISSIQCKILTDFAEGVGAQYTVDVNNAVPSCPSGEKYIRGRCRPTG